MAARRRVLFVVSNLSGGGAERVMSLLLRHLSRDRYEPVLALWQDRADYSRPSDVPLHLIGKTQPWHLPRAIRRTLLLVESLRPDLVLSTGHYTNIVTGEALRGVRQGPRWVFRQGNPPERQMRGPLRSWARRSLRRADAAIGNSMGVSRAMQSHLGLEAARIRTVPNFVDLEAVDSGAREPIPFERNPHAFVVVHAGRMTRQKHQSLLLRSFAALRAAPAELWMLGQGPLAARLRREGARLGLADRVRWLGFDPNPFRYFAHADCFALSSDWEGLPNAVIEAMACGLPAVSTRCPYGPDELIAPNRTGLLVPTGDGPALCGALQRLADDPDRRRAMGREAARRTAERFAPGRCLRQYEALFEAVLAGNPLPVTPEPPPSAGHAG